MGTLRHKCRELVEIMIENENSSKNLNYSAIGRRLGCSAQTISRSVKNIKQIKQKYSYHRYYDVVVSYDIELSDFLYIDEDELYNICTGYIDKSKSILKISEKRSDYSRYRYRSNYESKINKAIYDFYNNKFYNKDRLETLILLSSSLCYASLGEFRYYPSITDCKLRDIKPKWFCTDLWKLVNRIIYALYSTDEILSCIKNIGILAETITLFEECLFDKDIVSIIKDLKDCSKNITFIGFDVETFCIDLLEYGGQTGFGAAYICDKEYKLKSKKIN